jgi:hypothetical protein
VEYEYLTGGISFVYVTEYPLKMIYTVFGSPHQEKATALSIKTMNLTKYLHENSKLIGS